MSGSNVRLTALFVAALLLDPNVSAAYSMSSGRSFSAPSRSFSSPSRSYSAPSVSRSYSAPSTFKSAPKTYTPSTVSVPRAAVSPAASPSVSIRLGSVGTGGVVYHDTYSWSPFSGNFWFWMWIMGRHNSAPVVTGGAPFISATTTVATTTSNGK